MKKNVKKSNPKLTMISGERTQSNCLSTETKLADKR